MKELVAVLSQDGMPTGDVVSRNMVHKKGLWHKTVHIWFRNAAGELLLQKRSDSKESHPGCWDISCAGHVSADDSSIDAAVREIREELGIRVNSDELQYLFTFSQQYRNSDNSYIDNEIVEVYRCSKPVRADELSPDPSEVKEIIFLSVDTLKNKLVEDTSGFVDHQEEYEKLFAELI